MSGCYRCDWFREGDAGNICRIRGLGHYDVSKAREIVKRARRKAQTVSPRTLSRLVHGDVYEPHVAHVNTRKAGIMMTVETDDGLEQHLIEGKHRAMRAIRSNRPFRVYNLTAKEAQQVFIGKRAPNGMRFRS